MTTDLAEARQRALDAAEDLFYGRGVQAVGMDEVRSASGLSLKRLYQLFPAKAQLVDAYLERRDEVWRRGLAATVDGHTDPRARLLAVFDHLHTWFAEPGFRGCAWINAYGELGATSPSVAARARAHKQAFHDYLAGLAVAADLPPAAADQLGLLAEGAMVTAAIFDTPEPALRAKDAARLLVAAHTA